MLDTISVDVESNEKTYQTYQTNAITNAVANLVSQNIHRLLSPITASYVSPKTYLWDMPHTLIHGNSVYNNRLLLNRILLAHVYQDAPVMPKACDVTFESRLVKDILLPYKSFPKHIEFELHSNMTTNERDAFIEMLYVFTQNKSITGLPKNVFVLHGLEAIHNKHDFALRKLIEGIQCSAWILMDVESLSRVIDPIKSRCNCLSSRMCFDPIATEIGTIAQKDVNAVKLILAQNKTHDVIEVSLRLQIPNGHMYTGHVRAWTEKRLKELHTAYLAALQPKALVKAITVYTSMLRETTQQLMSTGIAVTTWLVYVIDIYTNQDNANIHEIVELAAKKQSIHNSKDGLILDAFIHELMFLL